MLRSPPPSTDKVLVSIASSVVIEKSRAEAVALLEERARDLEKTIVSILSQRNEIAERLNSDRQMLNNYVSSQGQQE